MMKESRRTFVKKSAYLAALSAVGLDARRAEPSAAPAPPVPEAQWMKLSIAHWSPQPKRMELARMMGVTGAVSGAWPDPAAR
jgi:hypothetical protein